jgi:ABC-type polar amino acid transport system ATPase subunit
MYIYLRPVRVATARALAIKPKVMLFDEPTSALDPALIEGVLNVMTAVAEEGMTIVVVTHAMGFATNAGTRLLFMDEGRIVEDGDPKKLIKSPETDRPKSFLRHVIEI